MRQTRSDQQDQPSPAETVCGSATVARIWEPGWPIDVGSILAPLARGGHDPTFRRTPGRLWRATSGPAGPATVCYRQLDEGAIALTAWGPGAALEVAQAPVVLGCEDDAKGFAWDAHPLLLLAQRRHGMRWRAPRTGRTWEALAPAILEQRVTGREARGSWARLVRRFGTPAPGPGRELDLWICPPPRVWAAIPSWEYHRAGVDPARARTLASMGDRASSLERLSHLAPQDARAALASLPGIGPWTAAEVAIRAWGDTDAVSFGDFHLADFVTYNLAGHRTGTDAQMAHLLAPWAGHRARAVRMIELVGVRPPRRGPRATITDHRRH